MGQGGVAQTSYAERYALTADEESWRSRAEAFARDELAPQARDMDREGRMRPAVVRRMGSLGFLGAAIPKEAGGGGAGALASALVSEEIGRVDGSARGFLAVQSCLVARTIALHASRPLRDRWLPGLLSGESIGCFALTEPDAGSDVASVTARAEPDGDGVKLSGTKHWITNGLSAAVAIVFVTSRPGGGRGALEAWLVPTDAPGWRATPMNGEPLGHRASEHARIVLDGVRVPRENRLGPPGGGFQVAMDALEGGRLSVAAGAVGIQAACLDAATRFARERRQFGVRIGDFQQVGAALADMRVALEGSRLLVHQAARRADRGAPATMEASAAKLFATESAVATTQRALRLHGARGYCDELPLERHYRDAIALTIYEGTSEIQRVILARDLLGKDPAGKEDR